MPVEVVAEFDALVFVADSATSFNTAQAGGVFITGSHGGDTAVLFALAAGARAAVFNDAGVGKEGAGIAGLRVAEDHGVAAVAVSHRSARIGDGRDTWANGAISFCNRCALEVGVDVGMSVVEAAKRLAGWAPRVGMTARPASPRERPPVLFRTEDPRIAAVDSASSVTDQLSGVIVLTGSHGGVVDGRAVRAPVAAAFFNDAGVGKDDAGVSRLPLLDTLGIPAATVDCFSARIGDGVETYSNGHLSRVNMRAREAGWRVGQSARSAAHSLAESLAPPSRGSAPTVLGSI
jgi:hypothetical protein